MSTPLSPMPYDITGEYYNDGSYHGAWDLPVPIGRPVYAIRNGTIHSCWRGVPNDEDQPGDTDYSGEPSNWILQWVMMDGKPFSVFYQHLSPNIKVKMNQKVEEGEVIGFTGDSGNTSGPHLHIHSMRGHQTNRYQLYNDRSVAVYPPNKLWINTQEDDVTPEDIDKIVNRVVTQLENSDKLAKNVVETLLDTRIFGAEAPKEVQDVRVRGSFKRSYLGHNEVGEV